MTETVYELPGLRGYCTAPGGAVIELSEAVALGYDVKALRPDHVLPSGERCYVHPYDDASVITEAGAVKPRPHDAAYVADLRLAPAELKAELYRVARDTKPQRGPLAGVPAESRTSEAATPEGLQPAAAEPSSPILELPEAASHQAAALMLAEAGTDITTAQALLRGLDNTEKLTLNQNTNAAIYAAIEAEIGNLNANGATGRGAALAAALSEHKITGAPFAAAVEKYGLDASEVSAAIKSNLAQAQAAQASAVPPERVARLAEIETSAKAFNKAKGYAPRASHDGIAHSHNAAPAAQDAQAQRLAELQAAGRSVGAKYR
ncbi:hypothetical protein [Bradyrhizobium sp.]